MHKYIRMKKQVIVLEIKGPILPGSISTAESKCGKPNCACKENPPKLHGVYYRWTDFINGKRTTKTISRELAQECERRISNYRIAQNRFDQIVENALKSSPWNKSDE